jgi:protocatechuate 3,4-dioxygenase beta subunit
MSQASHTPFRPYAPGSQPPLDAPAYGSTGKRHPSRPLVALPQGHTPTETGAPRFDPARYPPAADLARDAQGREAQGERIVVEGRITDEDGRPVPEVMIELWQANAGGRYDHVRDQHDAPLDPHFHGAGRIFSDGEGRYSFITIKPGAYPFRNRDEHAWRPNHIHFSLFGTGFAQRLVTQMYFPGDPLLALDSIFNTVPDAAARARLVARLDMDVTRPDWALGYRFDIVLRGRAGTPFEDHGAHA